MGKEGDLWDDSALIKAFDDAIAKCKMMHGMSVVTTEENVITNIEENIAAVEADNGSNEFRSYIEHVDDNNLCAVLETTAKIGETANILQIKENSPLELGSSNIRNGNCPTTDENPAAKSGLAGKDTISSDAKNQNEATWYSNGSEEYSELLNKYYELEDQRQNILQQLNQYSNWNYQHPITTTSTPEEYQASIPQPYNNITCYCPYGCQNWVVPCNSLPVSCSGGSCIDKSCNAVSNANSMSLEDPGFVKTAMVAAERALSSITKEANGGKDEQLGMEIGHVAESTKSGTDLDVVLKAWYSAGFYTGKYLSEQAMGKRKHG